MEKPNKRLFEYGDASNKDRIYKFSSLTGEHGVYPLGQRERLTGSQCPICDNYIVSGYDQIDKWTLCPNCGFNTMGKTL